MNILIIGNGFDLAHGLPTGYRDFLEWVVAESEFYYDLKKQKDEITNDVDLQIYIPEQRKGTKVINERITHQVDLWKSISNNIWIDYFLQCDMYQKENWIDFEHEISQVIQSLDEDIMGETGKNNLFDDIIGELSNEFLKNRYLENTYINAGYEKFLEQNQKSVAFSFRQIRDDLQSDLTRLIRALEIYLTDCVERMDCELRSPDIRQIMLGKFEEDNEGNTRGRLHKILSFNYTNTFQKLYCSTHSADFVEKNMDYIHGRIKESGTISSNNMVLGIDEYLPKKRRNRDIEFIAFKKYYQRIYKQTGFKYKKWLEVIEEDFCKYEIEMEKIKSDKKDNFLLEHLKMTREKYFHWHYLYIFGHSLDVTDKDVLRDLILNDNVYTTIFYLNKEVMGRQIANLVKVIGQDELIKRTGGEMRTIEFKQQKKMEVKNRIG